MRDYAAAMYYLSHYSLDSATDIFCFVSLNTPNHGGKGPAHNRPTGPGPSWTSWILITVANVPTKIYLEKTLC